MDLLKQILMERMETSPKYKKQELAIDLYEDDIKDLTDKNDIMNKINALIEKEMSKTTKYEVDVNLEDMTCKVTFIKKF